MSRIDPRLLYLFFGLCLFLLVALFSLNSFRPLNSFVDKATGIYSAVNEGFNQKSDHPDQDQAEPRKGGGGVYESLLDKPNDLVLKYVPLPYDYRYGSNLIPLAVAALLSDGPLLELGMGKFSTPLLHMIGADQRREVVSLETDLQWMLKFAAYNLTQYHKIYHFANIGLMSKFGLSRAWGMVLVDHIHASLRPLDIIHFANLSQIVVAHDSEKREEAGYQYEKQNVSGNFKFKCKYSIYDSTQKTYYVSTSIFSNFVDLAFLDDLFKNIFTEYGHVACDYGMK